MAWANKGSLQGPKGDKGDPGSDAVGVSTGTTAPANPIAGQLWLDTNDPAVLFQGPKGDPGTSVTVVVTSSPGSAANTLYLVPQ